MSLPKRIAVDFDGCLAEDAFPAIGAPIQSVIDALKAKQAAGYKIILSTCRRSERLKEAVDWCAAQGIVFDAVNENLPEVIRHYGGDTRKISADEYWGDDARQRPERVRTAKKVPPCYGQFHAMYACECNKDGGVWYSIGRPSYCPGCGGRIVMEEKS